MGGEGTRGDRGEKQSGGYLGVVGHGLLQGVLGRISGGGEAVGAMDVLEEMRETSLVLVLLGLARI